MLLSELVSVKMLNLLNKNALNILKKIIHWKQRDIKVTLLRFLKIDL